MDPYARAYQAYGFYSLAIALCIMLIFATAIVCVEKPAMWPAPVVLIALCAFCRRRQRKAKRRMWS